MRWLPFLYLVGQNLITVAAGDGNKPPQTIFSGTIYSAYADYKDVPDAALHISAKALEGGNESIN